MDLKDRVALVAGGSGLLGTAIVRALAGAGADIVVTYLERKDAARESCAAAEARHGVERRADQTDSAAVSPAVAAAAEKLAAPTCSSTTPGGTSAFRSLTSSPRTPPRDRLATNLRGPYLARAAAPHLKKSGSGRT
jgi:3-oxoacyl-[acyl-carrier protein] reductase